MAVVWPQVWDYLVAVAPTLQGWDAMQVFKGAPDTGDDPTDWAAFGYVEGEDSAGDFQQEHLDDYLYLETGTVRVSVTTQTGDQDLTDVQSRLFDRLNALDAWLRHDQQLGGLLMASSVLFAADAIRPIKAKTGYGMTVACSVLYTAQTPFPG